MYIAFKWLVGLASAMWIAMCCIDIVLGDCKELFGAVLGIYHETINYLYKNESIPIEKENQPENLKFRKVQKQENVVILHYFMFCAGAFAVTVFNRKYEIMLYTKNKFAKLNIKAINNKLNNILNKTADILSVAILKLSSIIKENSQSMFSKGKYLFYLLKTKKAYKNQQVNFILLNKLKQIGEERKNLGQMLLAAIHENKNIRVQYQLESMAKNRLVRHIEDTQRQIKENRCRYVSFQHLYLVTHQENTFLKARVQKLTVEKEEAERNLMSLVNEIYHSKNNELKAFCSRFIVRTTDNLLNSDVNAEIQKFLHKSRQPVATTSNWQITELPDLELCTAKSWPRCTNVHLTEIMPEDRSIAPLVSDAPKLKGLPGEYVWTVKDKNGMIEKLYEYDYESDFNNGDTIKRIRQYSVYFDKDCLLDFSNSKSTTIVCQSNGDASRLRREYSLSNQRFLTGSEAFQKFLQDNKNIVSSERSSPPLLCG